MVLGISKENYEIDGSFLEGFPNGDKKESSYSKFEAYLRVNFRYTRIKAETLIKVASQAYSIFFQMVFISKKTLCDFYKHLIVKKNIFHPCVKDYFLSCLDQGLQKINQRQFFSDRSPNLMSSLDIVSKEFVTFLKNNKFLDDIDAYLKEIPKEEHGNFLINLQQFIEILSNNEERVILFDLIRGDPSIELGRMLESTAQISWGYQSAEEAMEVLSALDLTPQCDELFPLIKMQFDKIESCYKKIYLLRIASLLPKNQISDEIIQSIVCFIDGIEFVDVLEEIVTSLGKNSEGHNLKIILKSVEFSIDLKIPLERIEVFKCIHFIYIEKLDAVLEKDHVSIKTISNGYSRAMVLKALILLDSKDVSEEIVTSLINLFPNEMEQKLRDKVFNLLFDMPKRELKEKLLISKNLLAKISDSLEILEFVELIYKNKFEDIKHSVKLTETNLVFISAFYSPLVLFTVLIKMMVEDREENISLSKEVIKLVQKNEYLSLGILQSISELKRNEKKEIVDLVKLIIHVDDQSSQIASMIKVIGQIDSLIRKQIVTHFKLVIEKVGRGKKNDSFLAEFPNIDTYLRKRLIDFCLPFFYFVKNGMERAQIIQAVNDAPYEYLNQILSLTKSTCPSLIDGYEIAQLIRLLSSGGESSLEEVLRGFLRLIHSVSNRNLRLMLMKALNEIPDDIQDACLNEYLDPLVGIENPLHRIYVIKTLGLVPVEDLTKDFFANIKDIYSQFDLNIQIGAIYNSLKNVHSGRIKKSFSHICQNKFKYSSGFHLASHLEIMDLILENQMTRENIELIPFLFEGIVDTKELGSIVNSVKAINLKRMDVLYLARFLIQSSDKAAERIAIVKALQQISGSTEKIIYSLCPQIKEKFKDGFQRAVVVRLLMICQPKDVVSELIDTLYLHIPLLQTKEHENKFSNLIETVLKSYNRKLTLSELVAYLKVFKQANSKNQYAFIPRLVEMVDSADLFHSVAYAIKFIQGVIDEETLETIFEFIHLLPRNQIRNQLEDYSTWLVAFCPEDRLKIIQVITLLPPDTRKKAIDKISKIKADSPPDVIFELFNEHNDLKIQSHRYLETILNSEKDEPDLAEKMAKVMVVWGEELHLYDSHPLFLKAVGVYILLACPTKMSDPCLLFKKLKILEKNEELPIISMPPYLFQDNIPNPLFDNNQPFIFHLEGLQGLKNKFRLTYGDLPQGLNYEFLSNLFLNMEKRLSSLKVLERTNLEILIKNNYGAKFIQLKNFIFFHPYISTLLLDVKDPLTPISNTIYHLKMILSIIKNKSDTALSGQLSEKEESLLSFACCMNGCSTGKDIAITALYSVLKGLKSTELINKGDQHLEKFIVTSIQEFFMDKFRDQSFLKYLTQTKKIAQEAHQIQYLLNFAGGKVGVPVVIKFDLHSEMIHPNLLKLDLSTVLGGYFRFTPLEELVNSLKNDLNAIVLGQMQSSISFDQIYSSLKTFLNNNKVDLNDGINSCFIFNNHFDYEVKGITQTGIIVLLLQFGLIIKTPSS